MIDEPSLPADVPDAAWLRSFRRRLLAWYRRHGRDLPWRNTRDAYAVWISEIMLQQTQVVTVLGYYERFLRRFPDVRSLAEAEEAEVLRYWEGLGYYRRARQLHRAAQAIVARHEGVFPLDYDHVLALPGVGPYTAGAILSFACDQQRPILEANTRRLYCRLLAHRGDPTTAASLRRLWRFAEELLTPAGPGEINQALIELGAAVCVPRAPRCGSCPVRPLCPTFAGGLQEEIPAAARKVAYQERREAAVVVRKSGKVLLRQCGDSGRWTGLWDFPRFVVGDSGEPASAPLELGRRLADDYGIDVAIGKRLTTIRHGVTRYRITLECFEGSWRAGRLKSASQPTVWSSVGKLAEYPLHVTGRQISRLLE